MIPIVKSEPVSIVRRVPPTVSPSLVSSNPRRTKSSSSLSRSTKERRSPESCSSFRSSEEPHAGFTTVVLGCLTRASLGGSLSVPCAPWLWHASVCRTDARKIMVAVSTTWAQYTSLNQVGNARICCRAGWGDGEPRATRMPARSTASVPSGMLFIWNRIPTPLFSSSFTATSRSCGTRCCRAHTTATFTQWIGGNESKRQLHSSPPSRPIQSWPVVVPK